MFLPIRSEDIGQFIVRRNGPPVTVLRKLHHCRLEEIQEAAPRCTATTWAYSLGTCPSVSGGPQFHCIIRATSSKSPRILPRTISSSSRCSRISKAKIMLKSSLICGKSCFHIFIVWIKLPVPAFADSTASSDTSTPLPLNPRLPNSYKNSPAPNLISKERPFIGNPSRSRNATISYTSMSEL